MNHQEFFNQILEDLKVAGFVTNGTPTASADGYMQRWFYIKHETKSDIKIALEMRRFANQPEVFNCEFTLVNGKSLAKIQGNDWHAHTAIVGENYPNRHMHCQTMERALEHSLSNFKYCLKEQRKSLERKQKLLNRIEGAL